MDVSDVLKRLGHLGLEVRPGGKHWKVYHPSTGVWLFDVSKTPTDPNWHYNILRHLRRLGLSFEKVKKRGAMRRGKGIAVDLVALKKAQDQAAAVGEHIPCLADLDEAPPTSPLWKRVSNIGNTRLLSHEAQQEVINNMAPRADARRTQLSRDRLRKLFEERGDQLEGRARERSAKGMRKGKGAKAEFVRIAINEVAPKRGIQAWKSEDSGQQTISRFLKQDDNDASGLTLWTLTLIDATMDHIEGLQWGIDPSRIKPQLSAQEVAGMEAHSPGADTIDEADLVDRYDGTSPRDRGEEPEPYVLPVKEVEVDEPLRDPQLRERYANVLLLMLESGVGTEDSEILKTILDRLDKLVLN